MIVIVMGVSGCGKSSVGRALAERAGWHFVEGDDLHPEANRKKMATGTPLNDADRWPWLDAIATKAKAMEAAGQSVIVACSALKLAYRKRLASAGPHVSFIYLTGTPSTIMERMQARTDHFMPPGLLQSQLETLEPPGSDEQALHFDIEQPVSDIAARAHDAITQSKA
ncbi:UNVERIFIED_CONTAM: hypothetical protein GTU68_002554 [Idotea baltica]|nr:hypothetical protein [Idotea baltica]